MHTLYDDHLYSALKIAVRSQKEAEDKMGYFAPSCFLAVLEEAVEEMEKGESVWVQHRKGWDPRG